MISGFNKNSYLDNPFTRFHENIEQYPDFLDDIDDVSLVQYDNFERFKPFQAKEGTTEGTTLAIPVEDNDTKYYHYDVQGESLWTNPPDPNQPYIDHGLDEDFIWAFNMSSYNQHIIKNPYRGNMWDASKLWHAPFWGTKLQTPSFYKEEKMEKFNRQWGNRLQLELIKMKHSLMDSKDPKVKKAMKNEIESFINSAYDEEFNETLKDVYVTNHIPRDKKYFTTNKSEDEQYYRY